MKRIQVGVADDHPVVRRGVEHILRENKNIEVLFSVGNVADLLEQVGGQPIDVLVCDYVFEDDPDVDGLRLLARLKSISPDLKVLFLSSYSAFHIVSGAMKMGASGFIGKKEDDFAALPMVVRSLYEGNVYLPPSLSNIMLANMFKKGSPVDEGMQAKLSLREWEVVRLLYEGNTIGEIADRLSRSPKTISNQKNSAMRKLSASNDIELVKIVKDLGLFQ
ncbi:response regulator transcription factor [Chromobacterium violaceum]|uniref:response regulator transcription factor n=1 Tax=Chromobacterium violaceum TaxID=536 RepID=UPI0005D2F679|nr:response regulator transcription factor [Chromobacterium violaceum]KJH67574.1 chemotaxis protein CheY [Chromobacterium violaceum]